jgi:hypothetical protein
LALLPPLVELLLKVVEIKPKVEIGVGTTYILVIDICWMKNIIITPQYELHGHA